MTVNESPTLLLEACTARFFAEPTSSMALLVFVAFSSATCEVEGTSGCGLDTHFSGLVPGGSLAAAGAIVFQNHSVVALERSAGSEPTLVWEGYPPPTCFISSVCKEEGP